MQILHLLEGTDVLFHATRFMSVPSIVESGNIILSNLLADRVEREKFIERTKIKSDKLYYLSLARSLHSSYISDFLANSIGGIAVFEFSGRAISRYGKILPFSFFDDWMAGDEMEDRLISDKHAIPISSSSRVHVFCNDSGLPTYKHMIDKFNLEVVFYPSYHQLLLRRGGMTYDQRTAHLDDSAKGIPYTKSEVSVRSKYCLEYIRMGIDFLDGKEVTLERAQSILGQVSGIPLLKILVAAASLDSSVTHEFMVKARKAGYGKNFPMASFTGAIRQHIENLKHRESDDELIAKLGLSDWGPGG